MFSRRQVLQSLSLGPALLPCGCLSKAYASTKSWDYGPESGPSKWDGTCSSGTRQSPINFPMPGPVLLCHLVSREEYLQIALKVVSCIFRLSQISSRVQRMEIKSQLSARSWLKRLANADDSLLQGRGVDLVLDYSRAASVNIINTGHGNVQVSLRMKVRRFVGRDPSQKAAQLQTQANNRKLRA